MLALLLGVLVLLAVAAGLFVPLERWFARRPRRPSARAAAVCVGLLVLDTFAMAWLGTPVLDALAAAVGSPPSASLPRMFAAVVLADVLGYWTHRLMHRVPRLWRWHALHHAPEAVRWYDAWRMHPIDFVLHGLAVGLPGALLGASPGELAGVVLLRKLFTVFLHADLGWRFGWLERVIVTPAVHRLHHSADPADHDRNFAGTFACLDRLFGTYRPAALPRA